MWVRVIGEPAMRRAAPTWMGVLLVAAVLFGPTAMQPSDLTGIAMASPAVGVSLAALWLVLIGPVGGVLLDDRAGAYLRALPIGRGWRWGTVAVFALVAQAPWTLLWAVGEGAGMAAVATVAAAVAMLAASSMRWPAPRRAPRWRGPVSALVGIHARALARQRAASLWRGVALALIGGAMAGLLASRNGMAAGDALLALLAVSAISLSAAVGALASPVAESDRDLGWLLASSGCRPVARVVAMAVTLGGCGALLGAFAGGVAASFADGGGAMLVGGAAGLGAILGVAAVRAGAWGVAAPGGDGARVVIAAAGIMGAALTAIGVLGAAALALLGAAALALVAPLASPREAA